ncbi:hypothetical protein P7K49_023496, partial [Saguinus oedipus]
TPGLQGKQAHVETALTCLEKESVFPGYLPQQSKHSCSETQKAPKPKSPKFTLISSLVLLVMLPILLLALWIKRRVKKCLMPSVADPKSTFPGLFEKHEGNFQKWIRDTQNLAPMSSLVGGEPDAGLEEPAVLQVTSTETKPDMTSGPQTGETEASGPPLQVPQQPL